MNSGFFSAARRRQFAEFQTPEARRRRQKLHADPLSSIAGLALKNDAALLLFQGFRIRQNNHFAVVNLVLQKQQSAMRVHHHGLAGLFEFFSVVCPALCLHAHLVECAPAAPVCWRGCFIHTAIIERFRKHRPLALRTGVPHKQPQRVCESQSLPAKRLPLPSSHRNTLAKLIPPCFPSLSPSQSPRDRRTGTLFLR
jgi:hypothetical protein